MGRRGTAERLSGSGLNGTNAILPRLEEVPAEMESVPEALSEIYFCNFSLFQSRPDSWAIGQIYPAVPLQRLEEQPTVRGVIADITYDSDGKIDSFIGQDDAQLRMDLHPYDPHRHYYLGQFLC